MATKKSHTDYNELSKEDDSKMEENLNDGNKEKQRLRCSTCGKPLRKKVSRCPNCKSSQTPL